MLSGWILRTFKSRDPDFMLTLWKTLVIPKFDYCSQVWCPVKKGDIRRLEAVQWGFIRKIRGTTGLNYWECLKKFRLYSLQRRRERYRIIYVWKILEDTVPNIGDPGIHPQFSPRNGRSCVLLNQRRNLPAELQNHRLASLGVHGTRLFNSLPKLLRDLSKCDVDVFKSNLDKFFAIIPDEPLLNGYTAMRRTESNSVLDMISTIGNCRFEIETVYHKYLLVH